ncbi:hypothetical protein GE061_016224 [Apolygus lucorum]|uniref:Uncharacterized protein n=1 Tax=Apolygus lucorum TaxID=248454 RepID=A0A8S9XI86_APOLU|nr:hypothetical protein GE061_016224 [Apolygus lucorum]
MNEVIIYGSRPCSARTRFQILFTMIRATTLAQVLGLCAIAQAMSSSLMADIKEVHLQSPLKTNKVKRAQEFIMFGNQQNRASSAFGNTKESKRASALDENVLNEEEEPTRSFVQPEEDRSFESNQLTSMDAERAAAYPHMLRDLYYSLLLRNMDLGQSLPKESGYMDLPLLSYAEDRPKRDTKNQKTSTSKTKSTSMTKEKPAQQTNKNKGERTKRDSLSQDLLALIRYMEAEKASKEQYADPREYLRYYPGDVGAREDFNDLLEPIDDEGQWYDAPIPSPHIPREREPLWVRPPQHKRFMVSKRRYDDSPLTKEIPHLSHI